MYCLKNGFKEADSDNVKQWDLADQCTLIKTREEVENMFGCYEFWSWLEFIPNAKEVLRKLSEQHILTICSIGTYKNISCKAKWIEQYLPFIKNCILINNGDIHIDKSIIDMSSGILIDDVVSNLETSNAKYKICFGQIFDWNKDLPNDCIRAMNWLEVEKYINMIIQKEDLSN